MMNPPVKVWTAADWNVGIPSSLVDSLDYEQLESLLSALHEGGADETVSYSGIVAIYRATSESDALARTLATLRAFFPGLTFEKETEQ